MSGLFGGGPKMPATRTELAPPAKTEDAAVSNAANAAMLRRRMAYGREKTMLASMSMAPAPVGKKELLGD